LGENLSDAAELDRLRVVLVSSRNPLNIGAAARAMSNFGFRRLRVVNPYTPAFREARSAVGAAEILKQAQECETVAEAVADSTLVVGTTAVRNRTLQHPLRLLEPGSRIIRKRLASSRVALLFGSEKFGLSNHDLSYCHWLLHIPTREDHISMNLGQAVAVALYQIACGGKSARAGKKENTERASGLEVERVTELLNAALRESGYPGPQASNELKVRRLVRRMNLSVIDAEVWQGILRQWLWKIRGPEKP